jgi:hypothetical protein
MDFTVEIVPNEAYYRNYYREWASQKWLRRNEPYLGIAMVLFWCCLWYVDEANSLGVVPYFFMAVGFYETIKPFYKKHKWLEERKSSRLNGQKISAHFSDDAIHVTGPFSSGNIKWAGIRRIQHTALGLFIIPENGISLFFPKSVFQSDEQIQAIVSRGGEAS